MEYKNTLEKYFYATITSVKKKKKKKKKLSEKNTNVFFFRIASLVLSNCLTEMHFSNVTILMGDEDGVDWCAQRNLNAYLLLSKIARDA